MKRKVIILIIFITVITVITFIIINKKNPSLPSPSPSSQTQQDESPKIVSTKPDPLDQTIVSATEAIEITFNKPLQNVPEFKLRIEPKVEYQVKLSSDRKTAKIIPIKPLEPGASYALYIGRDTKFEGVGEWGKDQTFYFRTVRYRGI